MKAIIDALVGILMILGIASTAGAFYKAVKTESILKVYQGLSPLETYTRKLTGSRLKY